MAPDSAPASGVAITTSPLERWPMPDCRLRVPPRLVEDEPDTTVVDAAAPDTDNPAETDTEPAVTCESPDATETLPVRCEDVPDVSEAAPLPPAEEPVPTETDPLTPCDESPLRIATAPPADVDEEPAVIAISPPTELADAPPVRDNVPLLASPRQPHLLKREK